MINTPVASKTIVASSVFLDLVGFSKLSTTAQVLAKNQFNATLRLALAELGPSDYWVRDLGDGALIICPHSPEHALFLALKVHEEFLSCPRLPDLPELKLRIGLNLGVVKTNMDLEGRANFLGDGINATQRVMDFAQPGQILASRSFVDAIAFLHADYVDMFLEPQARQDKHGRTHDVYAVRPSLKTLERLRHEVTPHSEAAVNVSPVKHVRSDVVQVKPPVSRTPVLLGLVGFGVAAAIWFTFSSVEVSETPQQPVQTTVQPQIETAITASPPPEVASDPTPALAVNAEPKATTVETAPAVAPPKISPTPARRLPEYVSTAAPTQSSGVDRNRCALLLNKSALGESISTLEKQEIAKSCR